ncbi:MAG: hypothetical protein ACRCZQ_02205 [Bacteroidales bacterium]
MWQIASVTGWSVRYILWGVNYQKLIMMLSDAPRYITAKSEKKNSTPKKSVAGFFQSKLKEL